MKCLCMVSVALLGCVGVARSAVVATQAVRSAAMGRDIPVSIVLPEGYDSDKDKRWPVVFCLHGAGGDHTSHAQSRERDYADKYGFIIVSPDGEKTSWWLDSPVDPRMRYETFLSAELVPYVDARYRTFDCRERRAIMGGSMGGYGACRTGFRHKDVFGAVGNIYGGVDFWEFPEKWDLKQRLGERDANPSRWHEFSVLTDAAKLRNGDIALMTVVGTDDFFLSCNRKLHDLLARNGVEHTYVEYRGKDLAHSSHTMEFFEYAMPIELEFFRRHFEATAIPGSIVAVTCPKCPARMRLSPDGTSATINLARIGAGEMEAMRKRARLFMDLAAKTRKGGRLRPMMGWSSWNTFGLKVNDQLILETSRAMKDRGLAKAGYRYVNIDDGFFDGRDETGRLRVRQDNFPGGMKPVVEAIHALGLKAGTYSDAGADTCGSIFGGDVHGKGAGLYGHDADDFRLHFLHEGFDFIKIDYCGGRKQGLDVRERYFEIAKGLKATGRDDVRFNICRWAFPGVWAGEIADSWRTTRDIRASWKSLVGIVRENLYLGAYIRPGHYNDLDMLEVGQIKGKVKTDFGEEDTGLTRDEEILHFGFWCFMSSPLLLGCDVRTMDETSLQLATNPFLLAMNQNDLAATPSVVSRCNEAYVLVKDADETDGHARYVCLLNLSEEERELSVPFESLGLAGRVLSFDLVERADLGAAEGSFDVQLAPHAARFYRLDAERRLPRVRYEAEDAILRAYHELDRKSGGDTSTKVMPGVPIYEQDLSASGNLVISNLGGSPENDLIWPRVRVLEGGPNRIDVITQGEGEYGVEVDGEASRMEATLTPGVHSIRLFNAEKPMPKVDCLVIR